MSLKFCSSSIGGHQEFTQVSAGLIHRIDGYFGDPSDDGLSTKKKNVQKGKLGLEIDLKEIQ